MCVCIGQFPVLQYYSLPRQVLFIIDSLFISPSLLFSLSLNESVSVTNCHKLYRIVIFLIYHLYMYDLRENVIQTTKLFLPTLDTRKKIVVMTI